MSTKWIDVDNLPMERERKPNFVIIATRKKESEGQNESYEIAILVDQN